MEKKKLFKHKTFNQQLSEVNINYIKHIQRRIGYKDEDDLDDLDSTYMYETLEKWIDLDCTEDFSLIIHKLGGLLSIRTLTQVFHRKAEIFSILKNELQVKEHPSLIALIELLIAFSKDLDKEFYPYFKEIFEIFVNHQLETTNVQIIENIFLCFAYFFKILHKTMIKDIKKMFKLYAENLLIEQKKDYIIMFAAQSFAFLIRKINDQNYLLELMFDSIIKKPSLINGVGYLLFETIKGVNNQFNSNVENFFSTLFKKQNEIKYINQPEVRICIDYFIEAIVNYINKDKMDLFWDKLIECTNEIEDSNLALENNLKIIINLFEKGFLPDNEKRKLSKVFLKILNQDKLLEKNQNNFILVNSVSILINNFYDKFPVSELNSIINTIFTSNIDLNSKLKLAENLFTYKFFKRDVFNYLIEFLNNLNDLIVSDIVLNFLTNLILKNDLSNEKIILNLEDKHSEKLNSNFLSSIEKFPLNLNEIWKYVVILPHVKSFSYYDLGKNFLNLLSGKLYFLLNDVPNHEQKIKIQLSFLHFQLINSLIEINYIQNYFDQEKFNQFLNLVHYESNLLPLLKSFNTYLNWAKEKKIYPNEDDKKNFEKLFFEKIQFSLSHQHHKIRKLICQICSYFYFYDQQNTNKENLFNICLMIEDNLNNEPREIQRLLNKLEFNNTNIELPKLYFEQNNSQLIAVNYLFGSYYLNYSPLWETIKNVILTYVTNKNTINTFWDLLYKHISITNSKIYSNNLEWIIKDDFNENYLFDKNILLFYKNDDRPDIFNHRIQILELLTCSPLLVEKFNRHIVKWFFDFLSLEIKNIHLNSFYFDEDISKNDNDNENDELNENKETENQDKIKLLNSFQITEYSSTDLKSNKAFFLFLKIFSQFQNPAAIYEESKLRELYFKVLCNQDTKIQKAAFDCLKTYRLSFLIPYYDKIQNLLDVNQIKSELVNFSNTSKSSLIRDDHRKHLIPVLMRILYGKILHSFTSSKDGLFNTKLKKKLIFRYISDFKQEDIFIFIQISFEKFKNYLEFDYSSIDEEIAKIDIHQVIPPKQIFLYCENLSIILENLGSLFPSLLNVFYKLIIVILKYSCNLLQKRNEITKTSLHILKQVRASCYKIMKNFFKYYPFYGYEDKEIQFLFNTDFNYSLPKLDLDSCKQINPIMKLFGVWSENARYFKLLGIHLQDNHSIYPFKIIISIYKNNKTSFNVINFITKIIFNLLNIESDIENIYEPICVSNLIDFDEKLEIGFGTSLCLPFVETILNRLETNLNQNKFKKNKIVKFNSNYEMECSIIQSLSKYVKDEQCCLRLIKLLISSLQKNIVKTRKEDLDLNVLTVISNLALYVKTDFEKICISLEPFFDLMKDKNCRIKLCEILFNLSKNNLKYKELSTIIKNLNSYNNKLIDTPDINKRLNAFKLAKIYLQAEDRFENEPFFVTILIKNCIFFIKNSEDYALRSESINMVNEIIDILAEKKSNSLFNSICVDIILFREIKYALKNGNDMVKTDFISILRNIIIKGKTKHKYCQQMCLLCSEDLDNDFWNNIFSIQYFQRTKVIQSLYNEEQYLSKISNSILNEFLLPIVANNLIDSNYSKYDVLKESSIKLFGKIIKYLKWKNYSNLLKDYLHKLGNENESSNKLIIKILCTILNNFNFDLSNINLNDVKLDDIKNEDLDLENKETFKNRENPSIIYKSIVNIFLPKLHQSLHKISKINMNYNNDKEKKFFIEDEEILRLPIAIALVKLLKIMPKESKLLETNIRSIILRVVNFLKSRAQSIREASRNALITIVKIIGPFYLNYILIELHGILKRGYMFHVLTYTIYSVLNSVSDQLEKLDLESCLDLVLDICNQELFSDAANEKEIDKITGKVFEAKKVRSYDIYRIVGKYMSTGSLVNVYSRLKMELIEAKTYKTIHKIDICLQKLCVGLIENNFIEIHDLLAFLYRNIKNTIPDVKIKVNQNSKIDKIIKKDSLLIDNIYKPKIVRKNQKTNLHTIMLHYLQILHLLLRSNNRFKKKNEINKNQFNLVEPFVPILINELSSKDPQPIAMSIRCLRSIILKFNEFKNFENYCLNIKNNIFVLLSKYGSYIHNENLDMKSLCFKIITVLLEKTNVEINQDQLRILLFYCDHDINDDTKQAQAFALLNAILDRKCDCKELREMMINLREILIQSDFDHIRHKCRNSWFRFLLNYTLGQELQTNLIYFTRQLDYKLSSGRESVLRLFVLLVKYCPKIVLIKLVKYSLIPLSMRIINDDNVLCKKLASKVVFNLIKKLLPLDRAVIFKNIFLPWFNNKEEILIKQLGCNVLGIYCDVEGKDFILNYYPKYMKNLSENLNPELYISASIDNNDLEYLKKIQQHDHLIFTLFSFLKKQLKIYPNMIKQQEFSEYLYNIWLYCEKKYLTYPHLWIRNISLDLYSLMFKMYSVDEVIQSILCKRSTNDYLLQNPIKTIWFFTKKLIENLSSIYVMEKQANLIMNNFKLIVLYLNQFENININDLSLSEEDEYRLKKMKLSWLIKRLNKEMLEEGKSGYRKILKRKLIYEWLYEMIKFNFTQEQIEKNVNEIMFSVVKDLTNQKLKLFLTQNNLNLGSQKVFNLIKKKVGNEKFNKIYSNILLKLNKKKINRKSQKVLQLITNPILSIKLKQKKRLQSKKAKILKSKNQKSFKIKSKTF